MKANILSELQSACAAAERVFRLIDEEPEPLDADGAYTLSDVRGDVEMEHITFGYDPGKTIIHDLSLACAAWFTCSGCRADGRGQNDDYQPIDALL